MHSSHHEFGLKSEGYAVLKVKSKECSYFHKNKGCEAVFHEKNGRIRIVENTIYTYEASNFLRQLITILKICAIIDIMHVSSKIMSYHFSCYTDFTGMGSSSVEMGLQLI